MRPDSYHNNFAAQAAMIAATDALNFLAALEYVQLMVRCGCKSIELHHY